MKTILGMLCLFTLVVGTAEAASVTSLINDNFENQVAPFGPGTDPQTFGAVTANNLPVNKPTISWSLNSSDAYIDNAAGLGFTNTHGVIYYPAASQGDQNIKWDFSSLNITSRVWTITWRASAAQVNKRGGHFIVQKGGGQALFELRFWDGYMLLNAATAAGSYSANTPLTFTLTVNLDTGKYDLVTDGTTYVTNGSMPNWTAGATMTSISFGSQVGYSDQLGATYGIDDVVVVKRLTATVFNMQ